MAIAFMTIEGNVRRSYCSGAQQCTLMREF